jgi:predicted phage-related endonuclease
MKLFFICILFLQILFAQKVTSYEEVFVFLESNGIVVGRDVSHDALYSYLQDSSINTKTGIDLNVLYDKIIQNQNLVDESIAQEESLKKEYNLNSERPTDKEVLKYLKEKNNVFKDVKEKRVEQKSEDENKSWFSQKLDEILEKLKF